MGTGVEFQTFFSSLNNSFFHLKYVNIFNSLFISILFLFFLRLLFIRFFFFI